jgi:hypothetical protein
MITHYVKNIKPSHTYNSNTNEINDDTNTTHSLFPSGHIQYTNLY